MVVVDHKNLVDAPIIVGKEVNAPLLYEGSSLLVDPENPLVLEVLVGASTAYSYDPTKPVTDVCATKLQHILSIKNNY